MRWVYTYIDGRPQTGAGHGAGARPAFGRGLLPPSQGSIRTIRSVWRGNLRAGTYLWSQGGNR